ncbi:alpha/beta hydrolase [Yersinia aleksiciae]|jgi:pimeloyl-ACP methyl ester carboxylesterase|uniref:alpha/beta hydrolase n=1 Tax=Yersinia aleksiciae TaxID=263819 RepID=UPI0005E61877|nr:alpha/beta fold hydrolase [Yersinia aleksiciae]CFQ45861.1 acetoin dehydrogenase E2 subunit dihydrolipoyllysine-residue acetyltransferase [Yersinia aleksiciae]
MNRRKLLKLLSATPLLVASAPLLAANKNHALGSGKKTFVMTHGAFHGGWCWRDVAAILRSKGHLVYTPTYSGLGERAHLLNNEIDLNTFIEDVMAVIECEELQNVVLVGHSFGGYVISGVADRMGDRIGSMIYLDAPMGTNGKSVLDEAPPDVRKARTDAAIDVFGTRAIATPPATAFGLSDPQQIAWVNRRMTAMPFKAYETPLKLNGIPGGNFPKKFIHCVHPVLPNIVPSAVYAKNNGWDYHELQTGHEAMITLPEQVAALLLAPVVTHQQTVA